MSSNGPPRLRRAQRQHPRRLLRLSRLSRRLRQQSEIPAEHRVVGGGDEEVILEVQNPNVQQCFLLGTVMGKSS